MILPAVLPTEPAPAGWPGLRQALWRASRGKLVVLFVVLCWSVGTALGGGHGPRADAGDLAVLPGHAPTPAHIGAPAGGAVGGPAVGEGHCGTVRAAARCH